MQFWKSGRTWVWVWLLVIIGACSWPLFRSEMFFTHDFIHGVRIAEMTRALHDGEFPVRWSSNFAYGYGMPLFEFYAPLPFYVGSIFYLLGIPLILSVKLIFGLANVLTAVGAFLLGRKLTNKWGGILASALITLAPYRAVNLYIRGAISETWGIMALVWVLYSTILFVQRKKYSEFLLIASLVTLFLSHNLLTMISAPFIAIWTVGVFAYVYWDAFSKQGSRLAQLIFSSIGRFSIVYLAAVAIASFYLVPALVEKNLTKVEEATTAGYFNYQLHFLYIRQLLRAGWGYGGSEWGPDDKLSFFLGFGQVVGLILAGVGLSWAWWQRRLQPKVHTSFWRQTCLFAVGSICMGLALFMTLGKAQPIWDHLTFFKFIQFPWRFYSAALVFVGLTAAIGMSWLQYGLPRKVWLALITGVLILTVAVNATYFRPESYLEDAAALYYDNPSRTRTHMSGILPDYIPKAIPKDAPVATSLINCNQSTACKTASIVEEKNQRKVVLLDMAEAGSLTFNIANYPDWQAEVAGEAVTTTTSPEGLLIVPVPAGEQTVTLELHNSPIRQQADLVSLLGLLAVVAWAAYIWLKDDFSSLKHAQPLPATATKDLELETTPAGTTEAVQVEAEEAATVNTIKSKSMSGAVSYFGRTLILNAVGLGSALLLSRYFSPEDFGLYGLVTQVIGILVFFSDIGLAAALVQKKAEPTTKDYATVFTVQQLLSWSIVVICLVLVGFGIFEQKFGTTGNWILLALAVSFPLAALKTIPSIILERKLDFSKLVVPQIVEQLSFHAILIYLAWQGMGALAYAYAILARSVLGVIVMYRIAPWKISVALSKDSLHTLLNFGAKFQLNDALARVKDQLFFMVIGLYFPLNQFGFIQWSKNWSLYPYNLTVQNVMAITFPTFSRLQHNKQLLRRAIEKSLFFISLLIFPIIVAMCLYIYPMVQLIPAYHKWFPALPSFILFTVSVLFSAVSSPLTNALNAVGHINKTLKLMVLWTVMTWIVTPICIFFFGFTGVSVAAVVIGLTSVLPILYVKQVVELAVWQQLKLPLVASVVMTATGWALLRVAPLNWPVLIGIMVLSGLAYLGSLFVLDRQRMIQEVAPLVELIKKKL